MSTEIEPATLTPKAARRIADQLVKATMDLTQQWEVWENLIIEAFERRVWLALEYPTWDAFVAAEIPAVRVGRSDRRELVATLTEAGLSTRAIAATLGVHHDTVADDRRAGVGNPTPEPEVDDGIVDAEIVPEPAPALRKATVGLDGKSYSRTPRDVPAAVSVPPKPRRPSKKQRAEMWERFSHISEFTLRNLKGVTDSAVTEATVDDLDGMRQYIADLRKGARHLNATRTAVQAGVERLEAGLAPASEPEQRAAAEKQARCDFFTGIAKALSLLGDLGVGGSYEAVEEMMTGYDPAELYPPRMDRYYTPANLTHAHNLLGWLIRWQEERSERPPNKETRP